MRTCGGSVQNPNHIFQFHANLSLGNVSNIFSYFLVIFLPVLLVSFILPMDSSRNDEALGYHSHQITMAERNCHWDGQ